MSHVIKEVAGVLGITLKHATTKHAQTIERQASGDHCGTNILTLQFSITTLPFTQVSAVSQAESFTAEFP